MRIHVFGGTESRWVPSVIGKESQDWTLHRLLDYELFFLYQYAFFV